MKIDRQIGIITTLQQKRTVTAPYLAEKFEVSSRTIMRDIEDICKAGIPIVTTRGIKGGISIMEGFALDTTVFTQDELAAIFTGLKSLDSVSNSTAAERLARKIGGKDAAAADEMMIDLSSFYKNDLAAKIEKIRRTIHTSRRIRFHYCYSKGETDKCIEPYRVVFKWSDWYVFGFCQEKRDFRLYKLRRLWDLTITDETYIPKEIPEEKLRFGSHITDDYFVTAIYDASAKYRLVEEYGHESFTQSEDGGLLTRWGFAGPEEAMRWFLSFGDKVRVLDPPEMVERMRAMAVAIRNFYES